MTERVETREHDPGEETVLDDIIDLEEYAKRGERPPLAKGYRIKINGESYVVHDPMPTGREILTLGGLLPVENYTLRLKAAGSKPEKIALDQKVDLRKPGVEKFKALPRDQTEG
ncbi:multiubiquitin domain-containing protein [Ferrovibrio sp.]|uniref:multiubiquitin domain-containing protein n=1 Tax=Ferrovibrio sp. TaxID=1917215 RepID=UPI0035B2BB0B